MQKLFAKKPSPFSTLLPKEVVVVHVTESEQSCWQTGLLPAEAAFICKSVKKRQAEFTAGRNCARRAIELLGGHPLVILPGPHREPIFPSPFQGTISHCNFLAESPTINSSPGSTERCVRQYCAAAVFDSVKAPALASIGIDIEVNLPLDEDELTITCTPNERHHIYQIQQQASEKTHWSKIIFSAKESFYKAQFMCSHHYLDFLHVEVTLSPELPLAQPDQSCEAAQRDISTRQGQFTITVIPSHRTHPIHNSTYQGYYYCDQWYIYTAITLPKKLPLKNSPPERP